MRLISQLIKRISKVLQKLLTYFNGTANLAFIILSLLVLCKNIYLNLNDSESVTLLFGSSLQKLVKTSRRF